MNCLSTRTVRAARRRFVVIQNTTRTSPPPPRQRPAKCRSRAGCDGGERQRRHGSPPRGAPCTRALSSRRRSAAAPDARTASPSWCGAAGRRVSYSLRHSCRPATSGPPCPPTPSRCRSCLCVWCTGRSTGPRRCSRRRRPARRRPTIRIILTISCLFMVAASPSIPRTMDRVLPESSPSAGSFPVALFGGFLRRFGSGRIRRWKASGGISTPWALSRDNSRGRTPQTSKSP